MAISANVEATATRTLSWLVTTAARIAVPVYQRQYRWEASASPNSALASGPRPTARKVT